MFAKISITLCLLSAVAFTQAQENPWDPHPKNDTNWLNTHASYVNNTIINRDNINVLFYGDSITNGWRGAGKPIFDVKYAPLGAANYGIGGDRTQHVLWRIINGETDGLNPKLIVLKIGTNNGADATDSVVRGIEAILQELRTRMPNAKILLLGILPRSNTDQWFTRVSDINIKISKFQDNQHIFFLDMWNAFNVAWIQVDPELYNADLLHLVQAGYQRWADTMDHAFFSLFNGTTY